METVHCVDNRNSACLVKYPLCEEDFKSLTNVCKHCKMYIADGNYYHTAINWSLQLSLLEKIESVFEVFEHTK